MPSGTVRCECENQDQDVALPMPSACAKESFEELKGLRGTEAFRVRGKTWHGLVWTEAGCVKLVGCPHGLSRKQILGERVVMTGDVWLFLLFPCERGWTAHNPGMWAPNQGRGGVCPDVEESRPWVLGVKVYERESDEEWSGGITAP